jgi:ATP-dependent DNA ligase
MARPWWWAPRATEAILYAFELLEFNAKDQGPLPLVERKAKLAKLLDQAPPGIVYNEHTDEDGATGSSRRPSGQL